MTDRTREATVITFGCRLNTYESEIMRQHLRKANIKNAVVINTCAVTAEAERQARQAVRRAKREHPGAKIIVTGCSAQISPNTYAQMDEVDLVIGNNEKLQSHSYQTENTGRIQVGDIMSVKSAETHMLGSFEARSRAFVQVQNGCNHRCTFCVIPFGRGNSRSISPSGVIEEIRKLTFYGYKEFTLTGVDLTSYGRDLSEQPTLGSLIRQILKAVPKVRRLRLSSLDPAAIDSDLWLVIAEEPKFMPHLHLSIQAGDDLILKRMKRRHSRKDVVDCCARALALRPNLTLGADFIAGFPTETESMFKRTLSLVQECNLSSLHVFPYSPRENTPAAQMPMVPIKLRRERAARLRSMETKIRNEVLNSQIGKQTEVLVEKIHYGRTENNFPVQLNNPAKPGDILLVHLVEKIGDTLLGQAT